MKAILKISLTSDIAVLGTWYQTGDYLIKLNKQLRIEQFDDMPQPTPTGGFMGTETFAVIYHQQKPAQYYRWRLKRGRYIIQEGTTDNNGRATNLMIDDGNHELQLFRPAQKATGRLSSHSSTNRKHRSRSRQSIQKKAKKSQSHETSN